MRKVYITRHGRSKHNAGITDHLDSPLLPDGALQCHVGGRAIGHDLSPKGKKLKVTIRTSPFLRCLMSTEQIVSGLGTTLITDVDVIVEPLLHESLPAPLSVGIPNRSYLFPQYNWDLMPSILKVDSDDGSLIMERSKEVLAKVEGVTILVTHGSPSLALGIAESNQGNMRAWDHSMQNAGVTKIIDNKVIWWSRVKHPGEYKAADQFQGYCDQYDLTNENV